MPMTRGLRLMSTLALRGPLEKALLGALTARTGHAPEVRWAPAGVLADELRAGAAADLVILTRELLSALQTERSIRPGRVHVLASSAVGLAVPAGHPLPDISDAAAVRAAFLAARSVAWSSQGASGQHFLTLLDRLGISEHVLPRACRIETGLAGAKLRSGDADLAIQQLSELHMVEGISILGPLPEEIGATSVFALGVTSDSADEAGFISLAKEPAFCAALIQFGLTPRDE